MRVVHCVWTGGRLHIWSERLPTKELVSAATSSETAETSLHPFAHDCEQLRSVVAGATATDEITFCDGEVELLLPTCEGRPVPSPHIAHAAGLSSDASGAEIAAWKTPTLSLSPTDAIVWLTDVDSDEGLKLSESTRFYAVVVRFARKLVVEQRFVPNLLEDQAGKLTAVWRPWLGDDETLSMLSELVPSMPAAARAAQDPFTNDAWFIVQDFLGAVTDALCREGLAREGMVDALDGRSVSSDAHVAWLSGLLDHATSVEANEAMRLKLVRGVRAWVSRLDERGLDSEWRLGLRLIEPIDDSSLPEFGAPGKDTRWCLSFELQSVEHPEISVDAQTVWDGPADAARIGGLHIESPHDLLLAELARAARLYPLIDRALAAPEPAELQLTTSQAYDFLREIRSLMIQQGFVVHVPSWWDAPSARLGVSLELISGDHPRESEEGDVDERGRDVDGFDALAASTSSEHTRLGLEALVDYHWRLSLGDSALSTEQFEELTQLGSPLVRISGRWVELRPEDVLSARRFLKENPGGSTSLGSALRLAFGVDPEETGLHIQGVHAQGWAASLFNEGEQEQRLEPVTQPKAFVGLLRPYQVTGLAWMMFLDRIGLGACLADDMGLGKTIQMLALLLAEREDLCEADVRSLGPTLIVAPLSVISNWRLEANRFAPTLSVKVHHGPERSVGEELAEQANQVDMVITTYALVQRDFDSLTMIPWRRVVLDEAQNIKNPSAKQTKSILNLSAPRRMALTGTPVENRLSELWSIMNFCNSGHLGTLGEFRRRFSVPIERRHSRARAEQLRSLTRPFILRRLKSDPAIAADLPAKIQNKVFCHLTPEQATLYGRTVNGMLNKVDQAQGMQRRGVVLATLIKLKQICNHPAQALREPIDSDHAATSARSGKCARLIEMLDEVLAEDQNALIFTQFRQMGLLLSSILRRELDREILFLHGGTPEKTRRKMIDRFQEADGSSPIFLLSLKAGGFGLNLTAASHVFHYDRWWNPAVENQATDRAHRIGQTRTVHVHKFVVEGTLEERIDQMIEEKSDLADRIINSGERGLTELTTSKLRELLTLRSDVYDSASAPTEAPVGVED